MGEWQKYVTRNDTGSRGQAIIEFTFCMVIALLMIYGTMMLFRWGGIDLAERRIAYDETLTQNIIEDYGSCLKYEEQTRTTGEGEPAPVFVCVEESSAKDGPLKQLRLYFYDPVKMNAVWEGSYDPWM